MFQIGDIVCLVSGGPEMTVTHIGDDGFITCLYFQDKQLKQLSVKPQTLTLIKTGILLSFTDKVKG